MDSLPPDFFILVDDPNDATNDINSILTPQQRTNLAKGFNWDNDTTLGNNNISSQQLVTNFETANEKQNDIIQGQTGHEEHTIPTHGQISISESSSTDSSRTANGQLNLVSNDSSANSNNATQLVYTQINPQFVVYTSPGQPVLTYPFPYQQSAVPFTPEVDMQSLIQEYTLRAFSKHSLLSLHAEIAEILKTYETNRITNNVNIQWIQTQVSHPTKNVVLIHCLIQELIRAKNLQPAMYPAPVVQPQYFYQQPSNATFPHQQLSSNSFGQYHEPVPHASNVPTELPSTIPPQPLSQQPLAQQTPTSVPQIQPNLTPSTTIRHPLLGKPKKPYPCPHLGCSMYLIKLFSLSEKSFNKKSRLKRHEEIHEENRKRFFCAETDCEKSYTTKWDLIQHQREKHNIISNIYVCSFKDCCEKFEVKKAWEEHIKQHRQDALNAIDQVCDLSRLVFSFSGTLSKKRSDFAKMVTDHGGQVQPAVSHKVTHLVSTPVDVANNSTQVKEARKKGIFIVSEGFVLKCIETGQKVSEKEFLLMTHGEGAENSQGSTSSSFKKQKLASTDENDEDSLKPDE